MAVVLTKLTGTISSEIGSKLVLIQYGHNFFYMVNTFKLSRFWNEIVTWITSKIWYIFFSIYDLNIKRKKYWES